MDLASLFRVGNSSESPRKQTTTGERDRDKPESRAENEEENEAESKAESQ